jgi:hypothetical protein
MKRLLTLLVASCLAVWACAGDDGAGLFSGNTPRASGGSGIGPTGTGANATATGATGSGAGGSTNIGGGTTSNPTGGTTSNPTTGGTTSNPTSGGTTSNPTSGGTTSNPTTGGTTSVGGSAPTGGAALTGYHMHDPWKGYVWTAVDTAKVATITPANFSTLTTDGPYCASGNVPVTADYSAIAMVGFNINQDSTANAPTNTWAPASVTSGGLVVNVHRIDTSTDVIRVQIQGPNGATDANDRWCATLSQFDQNVTIAWNGFNTACWDNSGNWYAGEPLQAALVFVPGMGNADTSPHARTFNFCVNDIGPASGGTTGTGGTGPVGACANNVAGSGTITDRYGVTHTNPNNYVIWANGWGSGFQSQSLTYNGASFTVTSANGSEGANGAPFSYPSIWVGNNGQTSTSGNLPRQVSALTSVPTCINWDGGSGEYNVAYDVWFSTSTSASNPPSGGYLMLWFHKPPAHQPVGQNVGSGVSIGGNTWTVWYGSNGRPVVSYVANGDLKAATPDLKPFIADAVTRGYIQNSWYLITIFAGFEIWNSGTNYQMKGFSAAVN